MILGSVIEVVYGNNLDPIPNVDLPRKMISGVVTMEERLKTWTDDLIPELDLLAHSRQTLSRGPPQDPVFAGFSVILRLRYLNIRLLLHRALLSDLVQARMAAMTNNQRSMDEKSFSMQIVKLSVEICKDSALETINICHTKPGQLGASWYSAYYSEYHRQGFHILADHLTSFQCRTSDFWLLLAKMDEH